MQDAILFNMKFFLASTINAINYDFDRLGPIYVTEAVAKQFLGIAD